MRKRLIFVVVFLYLLVTFIVIHQIQKAATTTQPPPQYQQPQAIQKLDQKSETEQVQQNTTYQPLRRTHVFYYPWYANPTTEGDNKKWLHWNHRVLEHWNKETAAKFLHNVKYQPPEDIGANFYPLRGCYSSRDQKILDEHMKELSEYVVVVSWWGRNGKADGEGHSTDDLMPMILKTAEKYNTKIAIHLEPYQGRTALSVKEDIIYILTHYGSSPALYKDKEHGNKIVIYIYDSYQIHANEWSKIFRRGSNCIRGTEYDAIVLGLVLNEQDWNSLKEGGFNGGYSYFAADGFTYASTRMNWKAMRNSADSNGLLLSLSVGPGYIDTRIRPWNSMNTKQRRGGSYFYEGLQTALCSMPDYLSITSYNEWHEGTQIEPSIPKTISHSIMPHPPTHITANANANDDSFTYMDFEGKGPFYYLNMLREWAIEFEKVKTEENPKK